MNVRRLAAIDMYGGKGSPVRRWIIRAEFCLGAVGCVLAGMLSLVVRHDSLGWMAFGAWLISLGVNYVPLAIHALQLYPPGRLEAELAAVDVRTTLRRYTVRQFWLFVPLALVILDLRQRARR